MIYWFSRALVCALLPTQVFAQAAPTPELTTAITSEASDSLREEEIGGEEGEQETAAPGILSRFDLPYIWVSLPTTTCGAMATPQLAFLHPLPENNQSERRPPANHSSANTQVTDIESEATDEPFDLAALLSDEDGTEDGVAETEAAGLDEPTGATSDAALASMEPELPTAAEFDRWRQACATRLALEQQRRDLDTLRIQYAKDLWDFSLFDGEYIRISRALEILANENCVSRGSALPAQRLVQNTESIELITTSASLSGARVLLARSNVPNLPHSKSVASLETNAPAQQTTTLRMTDAGLTVSLNTIGLEHFEFPAQYRNADGQLQARLELYPVPPNPADGVAAQPSPTEHVFFNFVSQPGQFDYGTTVDTAALNNAVGNRENESLEGTPGEPGSPADASGDLSVNPGPDSGTSAPTANQPTFDGRQIFQDGEPLNIALHYNTLIGEDHFGTVTARRDDPRLLEFAEKTQLDFCRFKLSPVDPHYLKKGINPGNSWGARYDDQWAIKRVGFTADVTSAWDVADTVQPVVVAIIDTGLDWGHADIEASSIWRNQREIPDNGIDDDGNGYIDDIIGWDFVNNTNHPWDDDGHGTMVAGIIAGSHNDIGIAGINPDAQLMIIKALDDTGKTRASLLSRAIVYAADNGARIINLSVGGDHLSIMEAAAIEYAHRKGALMIVSAGDKGTLLDDYGLGGHNHVLTVGATDTKNELAGFSNFGERVDLVAPGVDVISLRARQTDTNTNAGNPGYEAGDYVVGDRGYVKASGTSFSAPIVAGVASLVWGARRQLTREELREVLVRSATDVGPIGKDEKTGHGIINAAVALTMPPDFSVDARIDKVNVIQGETSVDYELQGAANTPGFKRAWVVIGQGEEPESWKRVGLKLKKPITNGSLMRISADEFSDTGIWQIVLHVEHESGYVKRVRKPLRLR